MRSVTIKIRANNQVAVSLANLRDTGSSRKSNYETNPIPRTHWYENAQGKLKYGILDEFPVITDYEPPKQGKIELIQSETQRLALIGEFQRSLGRMPKPSGDCCPRLPRVKRFEARQGQKLREAGAAMDSLVPQGKIGLCRAILLTIPADYQAAFSTVAAYSGWIMNRLNTYLRRHLENPLWFYVWELQKRGALHLHFCFYAPTEELGQRLGDGMLELWLKLLEEMSQKSGNDLYWSGRYTKTGAKYYVPREKLINSNQAVYSGCAQYFAKYSGKDSYGSTRGAKGFGSRAIAHPARIWGSSRAIKRRAREMSIDCRIEHISDESASCFFESIRELIKSFKHKLGQCFSFDIRRVRRIERRDRSGKLLGRDSILEETSIAEGVTEVYYISPEQFLDAFAELHLRFQKEKMELPSVWKEQMELPLSSWYHYAQDEDDCA